MKTHVLRSRLRRLAAPTAASLATPCLAMTAQAVAARALGPTEYGSLVLGLTFVVGAALFFDVTFEEALVRLGAAALHDGDNGRFRLLLRWGLTLDLLVICVVGASVVVLAPQINSLILGGETTSAILRLAAAVGVLATLDATTGTALLLLGAPNARVYLQLVGAMTRLAVLLLLALLLERLVPTAVIASQLFGSWLTSVGLLVLLQLQLRRRSIAKSSLFGQRKDLARAAAKFSGTATLATASSAVTVLLAPVSLARLADGAADVAQYSIGYLPLAVLGLLTVPLRNHLLARDAATAATGASDGMRLDIARLRRFLLRWSIPGVLPAAALTAWLLPVAFGSDYERAGLFGAIALLAVPGYAYVSYCKQVTVACGGGVVRTRAAVVDLILTAILMPSSVMLLGLYGAAVAVVLLSWTASVNWTVAASRALEALPSGDRGESTR